MGTAGGRASGSATGAPIVPFNAACTWSIRPGRSPTGTGLFDFVGRHDVGGKLDEGVSIVLDFFYHRVLLI
ncbi:hypothetical protein ABID25_005698 [Mesorhizobium abyssinicae]